MRSCPSYQCPRMEHAHISSLLASPFLSATRLKKNQRSKDLFEIPNSELPTKEDLGISHTELWRL